MYIHIPQADRDSKDIPSMCGAACLQMLFLAHGIEKGQHGIWDNIKSKRPIVDAFCSTNAKECEYLNKNHITATIVRIKRGEEIRFFEAIQQKEVPTKICHTSKDGSGGHSVVFQSINSEAYSVFINDPMYVEGNKRVDSELFVLSWNRKSAETTGNIATITEQNPNAKGKICPICGKQFAIHSLVDDLYKDNMIESVVCYNCNYDVSLDANQADSHIRIISIRLFSAGDNPPDVAFRAYSNSFYSVLTTTIYFEYNFECLTSDISTALKYKIVNSTNGIIADVKINIDLKTKQDTCLAGGHWSAPGNWEKGVYKYEASLGDSGVFRGAFEII